MNFNFFNRVMKIHPPNNTWVTESFQLHLSKKDPGFEWTFNGQISTQFSTQQLKTETEIVRCAGVAT